MRYISPLDLEHRIEDAMRYPHTHDRGPWLDAPRMRVVISVLQDTINELIDELNYQRERRLDVEDALRAHGVELPQGVARK